MTSLCGRKRGEPVNEVLLWDKLSCIHSRECTPFRFSLAGFFVDLHVHGTDPQTLPAMNALILIAVDAQQRKIAHRLEKIVIGHRYLQNARLSLNRKANTNPAM